MQAPSVTVLMTVYNGMPYLREAVQSILGQTMKNFTFLILNNGSTDGTREYLEGVEILHTAGKNPVEAPSCGSAMKEDEGIRLCCVHLPENIGRTAVLNKGLALVRTDITAIIDADDIAAPDRIAKQAAYFQAHPEVDLVGSDVTYISATGNTLGGEQFPADHDTLCSKLPLHNQFAHAACAFRTKAALDAGGYPVAFPYAQDFALWIAMLTRGGKAASIQEPLASIRVHPGQATRDLKLIRVRADDNHKLAKAMLGIPGLAPAARQAARFRSAGALMHLGQRDEALQQAKAGVLEAPLLLPFNPLLWQRVFLEISRRLNPRFS